MRSGFLWAVLGAGLLAAGDSALAARSKATAVRKVAPISRAPRAAAPRGGLATKTAPAKRAVSVPSRLAPARKLLEMKDYLGFRVFVQKIYGEAIRRGDWFAIKNLIARFADRVGFDLVPYWNSRNPGDLSEVDQIFARVDALMLAFRFEEAFREAQYAANKLKHDIKARPEAKGLFQYALHSMGRALFGARRFDEAYKVYQWISPSYPAFRQVLFEKMWAGFKAGRVDLALGAIASQRSRYFPRDLPSETYLLQSYLLRRLCREEELAEVDKELKEYEDRIANGKLEDWVTNHAPSLVLWRMVQANPGHENLSIVSAGERELERKRILDALTQRYEKLRPALLKNIRTILAFQHLATLTDTSVVLKPVEALKDRDQLLKLDLEVWPADAGEDWLDEMGKHVLIGDSLCAKTKSN